MKTRPSKGDIKTTKRATTMRASNASGRQ